jgi:mRNA interferase RelE/StbE
MAQVYLTRRFQKTFEALDAPVRERIRAALEGIATDPRKGKALTGPLEGEFSLRVGSYRIIYSFDPDADAVWLETVRHRRDVYRRRRRR